VEHDLFERHPNAAEFQFTDVLDDVYAVIVILCTLSSSMERKGGSAQGLCERALREYMTSSVAYEKAKGFGSRRCHME
jgi:hypothetical protein